MGVVRTLEQMIPEDDLSYNKAEQEKMMEIMAKKKTLIPVMTEDWLEGFDNKLWKQLEKVEEEHSVCDDVKEFGENDKEGQPMEVFEHLLHSINMVGLHYLKYDSWGVSRTST